MLSIASSERMAVSQGLTGLSFSVDSNTRLVEDKHHTGYDFWDAHWTLGMKDAASRLLNSQHAALIASFEKTPSSHLYKKLVAGSPDLKATLLQTTRTGIFSSKPTIGYCAAAEIFDASLQTKDLFRLLGALPQHSSDHTLPRAEEIIIKHLSKRSSIPAHHKAALDAIAQGLSRAKADTIDEVQQAFPGFDEAWEWLEEKIDNGQLTRKAPEGAGSRYKMEPAKRKLMEKRDKYIVEFVRRAARGSDEYGRGGTVDDWDDPMEGVDSDDSDYEEQKNARSPDLVKALTKWVVMLQEWPDKKKAEKVWDEVKESDAEDISLFTVDDVAESLASRFVLSLSGDRPFTFCYRCDWEYNHNSAKQYVADGLMAVYKTFLCPNLKALEKYTPKTTTSGVISITTVPTYR
jgi:hypothetical protein